jgi:U3 small nucleolar RNA-associated protein 20
MASSGSRAQPVKRLKKGTETTKSHRFEPFSQRIAKLKIDPIHRVRGTGIGYTDKQSDVTASYFKESLDHWVDMNLSRNFSDFVRHVGSLCENLPQLLYHEDKIMALLVEYIEKRDQLSMEPLLSLLSQFARDLGVRFEKHFATSVKLIASVAATHQSIDVVEWSFACLAWIFKFLSRLLVPDLRQLLGIMTPYLGKVRQKPFVSRFAAESMSFLVRKATLIYHKDKLPLRRAVSFLFSDLRSNSGTQNVEEYKRGIMSMFADAMRGVKGCVHSSACDIFRCLFDQTAVGDDEEFALTLEIVGGIVINIIHYVTAETFDDVVNVMFTYIHTEHEKGVHRHAQFSSLLVFLIINTRKGTRVKDWKKVHEVLLLLLQRAAMDVSIFQSRLPHLLTATAAAFQQSPMDELLPLMRPIMETMTTDALSSYFLAFCSAFSALGSERFHIIVLPYFQQ